MGSSGKAYLVGFHAVEEALKRGGGLELYVTDAGPRSRVLMDLARRRAIPVQRLSKADLVRIAGAEARVVALLVPADPVPGSGEDDLESVLSVSGTSLVVLLDGVTDPHNLGAVVRSADQFGARAVLVPERRSASETQTVHRVSAGAASHLPIITLKNAARGLRRLKDAEYWVFGAAMDGEPLPEVALPDRLCLVLGSEGRGISPVVRQNCDTLVRIPTVGHVDSLNISVAAGILLYSWSIRAR